MRNPDDIYGLRNREEWKKKQAALHERQRRQETVAYVIHKHAAWACVVLSILVGLAWGFFLGLAVA